MGGERYPHSPVSASPPDACPLCDQPLYAPTVRVRGGGEAHLGCAEQQAAAAWRRRRGLALGHLASMAATLPGLAWWTGASSTLIVVGLAWAALHATLHARYWQYTLRDLRRAWRRR